MPGDGGHLWVVRLLPFTAAIAVFALTLSVRCWFMIATRLIRRHHLPRRRPQRHRPLPVLTTLFGPARPSQESHEDHGYDSAADPSSSVRIRRGQFSGCGPSTHLLILALALLSVPLVLAYPYSSSHASVP